MKADKTRPGGRETPRKKPYSSPVLVPWGTLRDLTGKVGRSGKSDGGSTMNMTKTR